MTISRVLKHWKPLCTKFLINLGIDPQRQGNVVRWTKSRALSSQIHGTVSSSSFLVCVSLRKSLKLSGLGIDGNDTSISRLAGVQAYSGRQVYKHILSPHQYQYPHSYPMYQYYPWLKGGEMVQSSHTNCARPYSIQRNGSVFKVRWTWKQSPQWIIPCSICSPGA